MFKGISERIILLEKALHVHGKIEAARIRELRTQLAEKTRRMEKMSEKWGGSIVD
jgi:hypothetical protein